MLMEQVTIPEGELLVGNECHFNHTGGGLNSTCGETTVHNRSGRTLYVVSPDGLVSEVLSENAVDDQCVIIGFRKTNMGGVLGAVSGTEISEITALRKHMQANPGNRKQLYWERKIPSSTLNARYGTFHVSSNLAFYSDAKLAMEYGHPLCRQSVVNSIIRSPGSDFEADNMLNVTLMIVDNVGRYPTLFTILHGRVLPLTPVSRIGLSDGFYVTGFVEALGGRVTSRREATHVSVDSALAGEASFRLFRTKYEAESFLNDTAEKTTIEKLRSEREQREHDVALASTHRELEMLKTENELLKRRNAGEAFEIERNRAMTDSILDAIKSQNDLFISEMKHIREAELLRAKMEQERQSKEVADRKHGQGMIVETVKTVGIVVAAGVTLWKVLSP